ncbi:MAG: DUF998 domain-containing protein [Candidatus Bathyarchaeota archaeon]|jgi:hypothetical membrane protein
MRLDNKRVAGFLLFIGSVSCILGIITAEALYPGYSTSQNYISDLGVGPSAIVFNSVVFLLGVLVVCGAYFILKSFNSRFFTLLMVIAGVGAIGVGLFTEDSGILHTIFSLITFLFGGLSAIASSKLENPPFSYMSIVLGVMSLVALGLFALGIFVNLGKGGMERLIAYPILIWAVGFSGSLMHAESLEKG